MTISIFDRAGGDANREWGGESVSDFFRLQFVITLCAGALLRVGLRPDDHTGAMLDSTASAAGLFRLLTTRFQLALCE